MDIPGVKEAGYKPPTRQSQARERILSKQALRSPLTDLQAKLGAILKAVKNLKDSWPFLKPVNPKLVSSSYELPMCCLG